MRVKKLIITGFGPYALKQEIDFEKNLQGKNMFVIAGNTGAGKTTIFDAINFALYGEASGKERGSKGLRSDFADDKTPTEVELWFSVKGKDYYIKRAPEYYRAKQRGQGLVKSTPTAELKLPINKTITGFKDVTNEVRNILGITSEQFKQLVMIPQGEFKRLLNADVQEKEEIFRKIFGTEIFEKIQNDIKDKANKLENNIRIIKRDRANKIKSFNCNGNEKLFTLISVDEHNIELIINQFNEFIEKDKENQKIFEEKFKLIEDEIIKLANEKVIAESVNKKFEELDKTRNRLNDLDGKVKEYSEKQVKLEKGKKAISAKNYEDRWIDKNNQYKKLKDDLAKINKNIIGYKEKFENDNKVLLIQLAKEEERNAIAMEIERSEKLKVKAKQYEEKKMVVDRLYYDISITKKRIEEINKVLEKNKNNIKEIEKTLDEINRAKEERGELELKNQNLENKKEKIDNLIEYIEKWRESNKNHEKLSFEFSCIEKKYNEAKSKYEMLENMLRKNQAGILASKLENQKPCPVCGSLEHPNLAKIIGKEVTEKEVNDSKKIFEDLDKQQNNKLNQLTELHSDLKVITQNSILPLAKELFNMKIENVQEIINDVRILHESNTKSLLEVKKEIQELRDKINIENLKKGEKDNLKGINDKLEKELLQNNELISKYKDKYISLKTILDSIVEEFKGEIKTVDQLENLGKKLNNNLNALKNALKNAEESVNKSKMYLDTEEGKLKVTQENIKYVEEELRQSGQEFKDKVLSLGFENGANYKESKMSEDEINRLENEINEFNTNITSLKILYENQKKDIQGKTRFDLSIIEENIINKNKEKGMLDREGREVFVRISNNKEVIKTCKEYCKSIEEYENEYEVIGKISKIVNGENSKKISFERYVLASYFEQIIEAANLRFNKMTFSRFELLRKKITGDMRKNQGLDLEVFDNYTGKSRDIKTLSGGESFKASLSMALGLADVVQGYAGGIQLDTMFIDEGFGTLDPESLDNAIECLMQLQNDGRIVGVISHVQELKERIGAQLEVTLTNNGSKVEFKV